MAFLTDNNWYQVTFRQTNDAAWSSLVSFPSIPAALLSDIVAGNSVLVYVTNSAAGAFSFYGGGAANFSDTVLTAIPSAETNLVTTADSGDTIDSVVVSIGGLPFWFTYEQSVGVMKYDATEAGALKAFLP